MESPKPSSIGCRESDGSFTDARLHDEIMSGVDDAPLRVASAIRAMSKFGLTREQAEEVFHVVLPDDPEAV